MKCPKCKSEDVDVSVEVTPTKYTRRGNGCLWSMGRWFMIVITFGLWLLVGKRKGSGRIKSEKKTFAVCQRCGYSWEV